VSIHRISRPRRQLTEAPQWEKGEWIRFKEWLTRQALADPVLSPSAVKAYIFILSHINKRTLQWKLCNKTIAKEIGKSVRQVRRATSELERRGYLGRASQPGCAHVYRIARPSEALLASLASSEGPRRRRVPSQVIDSGMGYGGHPCPPPSIGNRGHPCPPRGDIRVLPVDR